MDILSLTLDGKQPETLHGQAHNFAWEWLGEGLLVCTPLSGYDRSIVLSAGIHGNETAPIELLNAICQDLFAGTLKVGVKLLFVLGNVDAMRTGKRYIENDMNRMFCGGYHNLPEAAETQRAEQLEHVVSTFFSEPTRRYHYDLHTAIRASLLPTFAMFPYQTHAYDEELLQHLDAADLDAVVYHNAVGKTFTHFTSEKFQAASSTLELGKAKSFGQNCLDDFEAIDQVLRAVVSQTDLPQRQKSALQVFKVTDSIIKKNDDFVLNLSADAPNFSTFGQGEMIATQTEKDYVAQEKVWILFPNPNVKIGLRAGLILTR